MKRKICIKKYVCIILIIEVIFSLTGCYQIREKKYYSDKNNYITEEAVVDNIIFDEDNNSIYFWLSQIDEAYQDRTFKVEGENANILIDNKIFEKIEIGNVFTYTSAPHYFGDGYCMPIVAIYYNDEELLSFEEGYENLMKLY